MESFEHQELKRLAVAWLVRLGCRAIATEVTCPISRYRVDVAGWLDHSESTLLDAGGLQKRRPGIAASLFDDRVSRRGPRSPRTIVVECKRSRSDFVRDDRNADRLKQRLEMLRKAKDRFERVLIPQSEPHLRESGGSLFPELEKWNFEASRTAAYQRTMKEIERIERRVHRDTKFHTMARYRLADHLVLFTSSDLIKITEVPTGWGLVECGRGRLRRGVGRLGPLENLPLRERISLPPHESRPDRREQMLRNIAVAASRSLITSHTEGRESDNPNGGLNPRYSRITSTPAGPSSQTEGDVPVG
ncbi:MAG: hypothetical protein CL849_03015 [Crocinitomicaceae bacterium]|nr:hypothetical protein [Crocinitomicaceae bacterium]